LSVTDKQPDLANKTKQMKLKTSAKNNINDTAQ